MSRDPMKPFSVEAEILGLSAGPQSPSRSLRARILASSFHESRFEGFVDRMAAMCDLPAERVRAVLADVDRSAEPKSGWRALRRSGVRLYDFEGGPKVAGADCGLVEMAPGAVYPRHRHLGAEYSLVLQGAVELSDGRVLVPGDMNAMPAGSEHDLRSVGDEALVFVVVIHEGLEHIRNPLASS